MSFEDAICNINAVNSLCDDILFSSCAVLLLLEEGENKKKKRIYITAGKKAKCKMSPSLFMLRDFQEKEKKKRILTERKNLQLKNFV